MTFVFESNLIGIPFDERAPRRAVLDLDPVKRPGGGLFGQYPLDTIDR